MNSTPLDYQLGDLIAQRTHGWRNGDPLRNVKIAWRTDDIKDGQPGFVGEELGGPGDGAKVWGYDNQIVWVRHCDGGESYRWTGELEDQTLGQFCNWWRIRYRWTRTGLELRIHDYWKPIAPGAVLTMGRAKL